MIIEITEYTSVENIGFFNQFLKNKIANGSLTLEHKKIIEDVYNVKVFYFLSKSEKNTPDGFVGFYINNHIAYGFPGSILYENISVFNKIEKFLLDFKKKNKLIKIILLSNMEDYFKGNYVNQTNLKSIFIRSFSEKNIDEVWHNQPGVFRTEVRKSIKRGYKVEKIYKPKYLYKYYCLNNISNLSSTHKKKYFENLYKNKDVTIYASIINNLEVGYILMMNGNLLFANYNKKFKSNGIMQSLYWECIKHTFENKQVFNMGLSRPDSKTASFKKRCGALQIILNEYTYEDFTITKKRNYNKNLLRNLFIKLFKYLPLFFKIEILKRKKIRGKII